MSRLKAFQDEIRRLVFYGEKDDDRSFLWKDGVPKRLDVYRNNTRSNWADTLDHDFPLTRQQFSEEEWADLRTAYFIRHPLQHWELNAGMEPFVKFIATRKIPAYVKELADYEWHDLQVFIHRARLTAGSGLSNPTAKVRVYQYQMFDWVQSGAPRETPPAQKPEVLVFHRDAQNTCHVQEADPLMLLILDHFQRPGARLDELEPTRRKLLPDNVVPLPRVFAALQKDGLIL